MTTLRRKFLFIFLIAFLMPLVILMSLLWFFTNQETSSALKDSVNHLLVTKNSQLQYYYDWSLGVAQVISQNEILRTSDTSKEDIDSFLRNFQNVYWGKFHHIFIVDTTKHINISPMSDHDTDHLGQNITNDTWLQKAIDTKEYVIAPYNEWTESDHYHEVLFMPILDSNRNVIRVIGIELNIAYIIDILEQSQTIHMAHDGDMPARNNISISFFAPNGMKIQHKKIQKKESLSDNILQRVLSGEFILEVSDTDIVSAYLQDPSHKWIAAVTIKDHRLLALLSRMEWIFFFGGLIVLGLIFLMRIIVHRSIISPIQKLTADIEGFSSDDTHFTTRVYTNDEIGVLADALRFAQGKISEAHDTLTEQVSLRTKSLAKKVQELEDTRSEMMHILEDVQKEKHATDMQLAEVRKFKKAVDETKSGVIITDKESQIIYTNKAVTALTGYTSTELMGQTPKIFKSGQTEQEVYNVLTKAMSDKTSFYSEDFINKRKDGSVYQAGLSVFPVLDDAGALEFFVGEQTDITARKRADKAKTEFVSIASHQLRTPLSAMRWYLEILLDDPENMTMGQLKQITEMEKSTKRMIELVNSMLNASRLEAGTIMQEKERLSAQEVLTETLQDLAIMADRRDISVKTSFQNADYTLDVDRKLLRIIFENVLSNAIKYSKQGGNVVVTLAKIKNIIRCIIKDDGIGIPKAQQSRIFEKMFRADNARKIETVGSGIGLYTIKLAVEELGGEVRFASEEGVGTTFTIDFPWGEL